MDLLACCYLHIFLHTFHFVKVTKNSSTTGAWDSTGLNWFLVRWGNGSPQGETTCLRTHICSEHWASPLGPDPCYSHLFKWLAGWLCGKKSSISQTTGFQINLSSIALNHKPIDVKGVQCRVMQGDLRSWQMAARNLIQWTLSGWSHTTFNFAGYKGVSSAHPKQIHLRNGHTLSKLMENERTSTKCQFIYLQRKKSAARKYRCFCSPDSYSNMSHGLSTNLISSPQQDRRETFLHLPCAMWPLPCNLGVRMTAVKWGPQASLPPAKCCLMKMWAENGRSSHFAEEKFAICITSPQFEILAQIFFHTLLIKETFL